MLPFVKRYLGASTKTNVNLCGRRAYNAMKMAGGAKFPVEEHAQAVFLQRVKAIYAALSNTEEKDIYAKVKEIIITEEVSKMDVQILALQAKNWNKVIEQIAEELDENDDHDQAILKKLQDTPSTWKGLCEKTLNDKDVYVNRDREEQQVEEELPNQDELLHEGKVIIDTAQNFTDTIQAVAFKDAIHVLANKAKRSWPHIKQPLIRYLNTKRASVGALFSVYMQYIMQSTYLDSVSAAPTWNPDPDKYLTFFFPEAATPMRCVPRESIVQQVRESNRHFLEPFAGLGNYSNSQINIKQGRGIFVPTGDGISYTNICNECMHDYNLEHGWMASYNGPKIQFEHKYRLIVEDATAKRKFDAYDINILHTWDFDNDVEGSNQHLVCFSLINGAADPNKTWYLNPVNEDVTYSLFNISFSNVSHYVILLKENRCFDYLHVKALIQHTDKAFIVTPRVRNRSYYITNPLYGMTYLHSGDPVSRWHGTIGTGEVRVYDIRTMDGNLIASYPTFDPTKINNFHLHPGLVSDPSLFSKEGFRTTFDVLIYKSIASVTLPYGHLYQMVDISPVHTSFRIGAIVYQDNKRVGKVLGAMEEVLQVEVFENKQIDPSKGITIEDRFISNVSVQINGKKVKRVNMLKRVNPSAWQNVQQKIRNEEESKEESKEEFIGDETKEDNDDFELFELGGSFIASSSGSERSSPMSPEDETTPNQGLFATIPASNSDHPLHSVFRILHD